MKKYAITGASCLGLAVWYCLSRDFPTEKYRTLCDAFTIPGVLCLCLGALLWAGKRGAFCGIGYCLGVTKNALLPGRREQETYYDYVTRRRQKHPTAYGYLLITGTACMAIALIFLMLFYS